jgi:glucose-6-phosphate 1-dehydrogenase
MMSTFIVIFGASGDLTARKLIPALYNNFRKHRLPADISIIGFSRSPLDDGTFREKMKRSLQTVSASDYRPDDWERFAATLSYHAGDVGRPMDLRSLRDRMERGGGAPDVCLYYLATTPDLIFPVLHGLREVDLLSPGPENAMRRVVIEKPFGHDLASARELTGNLQKVAREAQIYRIDHYLGKETVQNLLVLRFGNAIFEPLWNRNYIDHVQITVAEMVGVEHRAAYYEKTGVLRDMFQNHLLQILTLVAMEPPSVFGADALRNEKVKVLTALREIPPELSARYTVRAQYDGYRLEPGVAPGSTTETFAAIRCFVDNWRWQGVPFFLRSGKKLADKASEVVIQFRRPPTQILDMAAGRTELFTNRLSICIQPDEGMHLRFVTKVPDEGLRTRPVDMEFHYSDSFGTGALPEAYERLLLDALNGDASLFARSDEIEHAWRFIDEIRAGWEGDHAAPVEHYEQGSWGPAGSDNLLGRDGRWWVHDCAPHGVRV